MKTKKHSKQIRDNIIEKYQSGEGYTKISKALDISRSSVRTIVKKWKEYGTTVNLPRVGCCQKVGVCAKKALVRETITRSVGTLEEMQSWRIKNLWKDGKTRKTISRCAKLIQACPQTLKAVIAAKGATSKYWFEGMKADFSPLF